MTAEPLYTSHSTQWVCQFCCTACHLWKYNVLFQWTKCWECSMPKMSTEGSLDLCLHWQKEICHKRVTDKGDEQETSISGRKTASRRAVNCWIYSFLYAFVCTVISSNWHLQYLILSLHFAWVIDDAKCIVVTRVCVSVCLCVCLVCPRPYAHTTARTRI